MTTEQQHWTVHDTFALERDLAAAPARVFAAFADPDVKARWFIAPDGWESGPRSMDFRVGGTESSRGSRPGGPLFTYNATFHEIVPDARIVSSYVMHMDERLISASITTVELEPRAEGGTHLVVTEQAVFLDGGDDAESRSGGIGWQLDKLVELVDA